MITVQNEQSFPIDTNLLKADAQIILDHLGYGDYDLGILLCDEGTIHQYNKKYRDKDKPTDILSFPYYPDLKPGETITPENQEGKNIGDIIICPLYVQNDLERWGQDFKKRMKVLLVHGICHLLGYDHIKDEDYEVMKKKENELLDLI